MIGEVNSLIKAKYENGELCLTVDHYNAVVILEILATGFGFGFSVNCNPLLERDLKSLQAMKSSAVAMISDP